MMIKINEYYPTLLQMAPWNKTYPVTWIDGRNIFRGPKIGETAPDESLVVKSNEPRQSLHILIDTSFQSGKKVFVLIFDGIDHGDTTSYTQALAQEIDAQFAGVVDALVITNYYDKNSYDAISNIVGDIDGTCAKQYGATGSAIYVVDKEKKIIWKSSGFLKEKLYLYLNSLSDSV